MWTSAKTFLLSWLPRWLRPRYILDLRARSSEWKKLRAAHLEKEPACVACGKTADLDVHHIIPVFANPSRELDPDNLITLCGTRCHIVFGHFMCYHCYNPHVRKMAQDYRASMRKRNCLETFKKNG